ncbi:MAG: hypothetical protein B6229_02990 [Spirochaetaceae bacterium 4572_7]|nr:MAG: hypothetical protein B6229_02990 [Spirochaetaceae bacterium 4572_7]
MVETSNVFKSVDNLDIHYYKWVPDESITPKAVFYLVHGSLEHSYRYIHVAKELTDAGYVVYGVDLRGHGRSVEKLDDLFYFSDKKDGWSLAIDDVERLSTIIKNENKELPIFIFGHSMGSFLIRDYISRSEKNIAGAIISGSGVGVPVLQIMLAFIAKIMILVGMKKRKSPFLHHMVYGTLDSMIKGHKIKGDFISRDLTEVEKYQSDPFCNKTATVDYIYEMLCAITRVNKFKNIKKYKKTIPLYLMSGGECPVGGKGKGINKLGKLYQKANFSDVTVKVYPEARHELVNEINRQEVISDMIEWLNKRGSNE